ncbi:LGFP repeat-containing protein [Serinibacter arcticus]|uniref:LGFP repeat-containing protein n=1 Tax=Serinibacter arcticus TaxID=1655435 RepID=A0A4Z1E0T4_9MICO|nr:hypothetical protein [Serinibacter arcticus]TGO04083.1 hypothetical protein SERN_2674 [Serinibacter arcticus]
MTAIRRVLTALAAAVVAAVVVVAAPSAPVAEAATGSDFRAGNIISDAMFYDSGSMGVAEIQQFLNQRGANCVAGEMPCLKDFRENTRTSYAQAGLCDGYLGQPNESAAQIIYTIARSCRINPQTLLVLLEKEQSLVARSRPTARSYQIAMGYGCPDTAPCDAEYYGFQNQTYRAARQFQVYKANPTRYGYQAGRVNSIQWHPNAACGSSPVYIENQATAALYIYTPYQPNAAALNNLYGTGDSCSSYGNRNFWRIYTDWFGNTGFPVIGAIRADWQAEGGATGYFGSPRTAEICRADGTCAQRFERGTITYRPGSGITRVIGSMHANWWTDNGPTGYFGYPLGNEVCRADGSCAQRFERGTITFRPGVGIVRAIGSMNGNWWLENGPTGYFGYPLGNETCRADGACAQRFERGTITFRPGGGIVRVIGATNNNWSLENGPTGYFGYPLSSEVCRADGACAQRFERGTIAYRPSTGVVRVIGATNNNWWLENGPTGYFGQPLSSEVCRADGACAQRFERGTIAYRPSTGIVRVIGSMHGTWWSDNGPTGTFGYPVSPEEGGPAASTLQRFDGGAYSFTGSPQATRVRDVIASTWLQNIARLGSPTGEEVVTSGSRVQRFQTGTITVAADGSVRVS